MVRMAKHAQETALEAKPRSRADVWFVLVLTGGASAFLQMWHATHSGSTAGVIDVVVGLVPAGTAIGLSHVVVTHKAAAWLRVITVGVMLAFMAAAASASSTVVQPVEMRDFNWVFSLALDAAELACVWILLGNSERKAAESAALILAEKVAGEARTAAVDSAQKVAWHQAELARVNAELAEARTALAAAATARKRPAATGRKRTGSAARKQQPVTDSPTGNLSPEAAGMDLDTEALVLKYIGEGHSASEAGVMAGVTDGRGRQIARLAKAKQEPAGDDRSDGDMATGEQPRVTEHTEGQSS
jgi:hypothetical protein